VWPADEEETRGVRLGGRGAETVLEIKRRHRLVVERHPHARRLHAEEIGQGNGVGQRVSSPTQAALRLRLVPGIVNLSSLTIRKVRQDVVNQILGAKLGAAQPVLPGELQRGRPAAGEEAVVLHHVGQREEAGGEPAFRVPHQLLIDLRLILAGNRLVMRLEFLLCPRHRPALALPHEFPRDGLACWIYQHSVEFARPETHTALPVASSTSKVRKARRKPTPEGNLCPTRLST